MANSDIIKIGFDYRASLEQFKKDTDGVFDGISNKAGKQRITIQLDAKDDKVIDKIKELQKLKLDKFTFEFGDSGLKEQLQTFEKLENKINEIINLSKGIGLTFNTKNKTEAYNQLKECADAFKDYYGNEEAMATEAGSKAAYSYYKAYEEALRKGVAQSKLEKVTIDFDVNDSFFNKERIVSDRINEFSNFRKYGGIDESELTVQITALENRLVKFNYAYSQVKTNLGEAPITPEIIQNIEEYVRYLELAEARAKNIDTGLFSQEDVESTKNVADLNLKSAMDDAIAENQKYTESLKQQRVQADTTAESVQTLSEVQKETAVTNESASNNSQIEELKSDIQEVKTELVDVKDRISNIESNGFENIREDVEKTKDSVKELNSELAEMKSNLSSTPQVETNISSGNSSQINVTPTSITSADAIQKENDALEATAQKATEAATSKEKFSEANQRVKESADESVSSIKDEANAFSQAEWDKNVQAIQDYMDAVTKLNNLKAKDKDTGKNATNISRQEQEVEKLKEAAYEARAALTSMINPHDVDIDTWKDWVNAMKQFDQASLGSAESLAKLEDALRNASDARKNYINSVKDKHTGYSNDYKNALSKNGYLPANAFKEKVAQYQALCDKLIESANDLSQKDIVSQEQLDSFEELKKECESARQELTKMSASDKGAWAVDVQKEISKITKELHENSNFSDEAKQKLQGFIDQLNAGDISDTTLKKIHEEFLKITNAEKAAGREGKNFIDILKNSGIHKIAADLVGMFSVYDLINLGKQASSIVIDLNTQITELAKVSEATSSQIYDDFSSYADIAKNVRGTISDTISATADWSKNGYSIPDSKQLAEISQLYKNVGDGIDIEEANESLISTLKGFQLAVDQAEHIVDVFNEVSNNEAISSAGIGQALQRSAASFNAANTSLEKSVALVTATNSVLQDPEKVGNMWRTVSARLRGSETELKEMGEDTDGLVESTSKLQSLVKGITGFDIMKDKDTYKDIYDIVLGIGESWKDLSDIDRASLLEALAGKQQSNALAAALSNIDILKKSYKEATRAEGSARKENEEYAKSIQASIDLAKAKLEELSNDLLSSSFLKGAIDAGGKLIDILDGIVKSGNTIPAIFTAIGAAFSLKNVGGSKIHDLILF